MKITFDTERLSDWQNEQIAKIYDASAANCWSLSGAVDLEYAAGLEKSAEGYELQADEVRADVKARNAARLAKFEEMKEARRLRASLLQPPPARA